MQVRSKDILVLTLTTRIFFPLSLAFCLAGCVSGGNPSIANEDSAVISSQITTEVTTKAQIQQEFGDPSSVQFLSNGDTVWTYAYTQSSADARDFIPIVGAFSSGTHGYEKELIIDFSPDGIVQKYAVTKSKISANAGF